VLTKTDFVCWSAYDKLGDSLAAVSKLTWLYSTKYNFKLIAT